MGARIRSCRRCGEPQRGSRFCGRCGALLAPALDATRDPGGRVRRPLIRLMAALAALAVAGMGAWLAGAGQPTADDVVLPVDAADRDPGDREGVPTAPADARNESVLTCLGDEDCVRWRLPLPGEQVLGLEARADAGLVVATRPTAHDRASAIAVGAAGEIVWRNDEVPVTGAATRGLVGVGDLLLLRTGHTVTALESDSGRVRWRSDGVGDRGAWMHDATVRGDTVVLALLVPQGAADDGRLAGRVVALDAASGALRWEHRADHVDVADGVALLARDGEVTGVEIASGEPRWRAGPYASPDGAGETTARPGPLRVSGAGDDTVVVERQRIEPGGDEVVLLDTGDGRERARLPGRLVTVHDDPPVVVVRSTRAGPLVGHHTDGTSRWEHPITVDGWCCARATASSGRLLLRDSRGRLAPTILDPGDGRVRRGQRPRVDGAVAGLLDPRTLHVRDPGGPSSATLAVDLRDGRPRWRAEHAVATGEVLDDAVLVVLDRELVAVPHAPG